MDFWILFKQGRAGVGVLTDVFFPSLTMEDLKTGKFSPAGAERPRLVFKKIHTHRIFKHVHETLTTVE